MPEDNDLRTEICMIISDMLDNPDKHGIYPTTKCYDRLEALVNSYHKNEANLVEALEKIKNGDYDNAHSPQGASLFVEQVLNRHKESRKNA